MTWMSRSPFASESLGFDVLVSESLPAFGRRIAVQVCRAGCM